MVRFIFISISWLLLSASSAQNTVGLLSYSPAESYEGYNLFYPHNQSAVFLIDNCGQLVHTWPGEEDFVPGNMVYLLDDGNIVKCVRAANSINDPIWAGGGGAIVEIRDWNNDQQWRFELNDSLRRLHHDIAVISNGNILMIAWESKSADEAILAGRDPQLLPQEKLWPDYILEVDPTTDQIVWEWHAWDHLIQDFDPTKENFGIVAEHPELIDINYDTSNGNPDWLHSNAIDYNAELDQILLTVPNFDEVWIIDHSTTTEEAAGHSGGRSGRGGDLLYRWGNPASYRSGDPADQKLFFAHDAQWIDDFLPRNTPDYGKIALFNNQAGPDFSTVNIFQPVFDTGTYRYPMSSNAWGPTDFDLTLTHPADPTRLHSTSVSGLQVLPNGNTLICSGRWGYVFEITPDRNIVWEYKIPLKAGRPVAQGTSLTLNQNFVFRFRRYPIDYPAFAGRDLNPKGYLELEPDTTFCDMILPTVNIAEPAFEIFPNPASDYLIINYDSFDQPLARVMDMAGRVIYSTVLPPGRTTVNSVNWPAGLYLIQIEGAGTRKILVRH